MKTLATALLAAGLLLTPIAPTQTNSIPHASGSTLQSEAHPSAPCLTLFKKIGWCK